MQICKSIKAISWHYYLKQLILKEPKTFLLPSVSGALSVSFSTEEK
jgi:hypothetical protein